MSSTVMSLTMNLRERSDVYNRDIAVPRAVSDLLKFDATISALGIGLIALGMRGLSRLRNGGIQPAFSLLKLPILPRASIFSGLGIFMASTMWKVNLITKMESKIDNMDKEYLADIRAIQARPTKHD